MTDREKALARFNWITVQEVAAAIRRSDDFVLRRIHNADRQGFRFEDVISDGAGYLINPAELDRYFATHKVTINAA